MAATPLPVPMPARLMLLLDSRSPAGAHGHSAGMEAAVARGQVVDAADVAAFCRGRLYTAGQVAAGFAAQACRGWQAGWTARQWHRLDREFSARTPSEATRAASRSLGSGLRRLLLASTPDAAEALALSWLECGPPAPHHPLVLGAATALCAGDDRIAARAAALTCCTAPASAAVRLLGLDPYAVHAVLSALAEEIDEVGDRAAADHELPALSAPALDLLADVHTRMEVRLFAS
jgi:urease accessory protein